MNKSFLSLVADSMFNSSDWAPVGEFYTLDEILESGALGFAKKDVVSTTVREVEFSDGSTTLRIEVLLKNGQKPQLKAGKAIQCNLDDGVALDMGMLFGQELTKLGQKNIIRFDYWPTQEDKEKALAKREEERKAA